MSDDDRDLTQQLEDTHRNWTGGEWSPQVTIDQFRIRGSGQRSQILDQFDAELRNADTSSSEGNLRKISELTELRARLGAEHRTMLRVRR